LLQNQFQNPNHPEYPMLRKGVPLEDVTGFVSMIGAMGVGNVARAKDEDLKTK